MSGRWRVGAFAVLAGLALTTAACDLLMTEPAPATRDVTVSFQIGATPPGGTATAFSRIRRVLLRFSRADQSVRDTVLAVLPSDGRVVARVTLLSEEQIDGLGVSASLGYGGVDLFQGFGAVAVVAGEPASAVIPLNPVANRVLADQPVVQLVGVGATAQLTSTVLFQSGDTITGLEGTWVVVDPGIVTVTPGGSLTTVAFGTARLEVRHLLLADTATVQVTRIAVQPPPTR